MYSALSGPPARIPLTPLSAEQWASIPVLQLTPISVTTSFYYEPAIPFGILWCWPPLNSNSIELFTWGFLTPPAALTDLMTFPPGYEDAIIFTLAARIWPQLTNSVLINKYPLTMLRADAKIAFDRVKKLNAPQPKMRNDFVSRSYGTAGSADWSLLFAGLPY